MYNPKGSHIHAFFHFISFNLFLRLHRLGVIEQLLRIILRLDALQPRQVDAIVLLLRHGTRQPRIGVVDVRAPVGAGDGVGDGVDPAVEEAERGRGVGLVVLVAVVELDDVQLVAVRVRSGVVGDLGHLRVLAAVRVELEEPEAVHDLVGHVEVVVDEGLGGGAVQALEGQALGVEVLLLGGLLEWWGVGGGM